MLGISSEQLQDFLHAQFTSANLATFDSLVGEFAFLFLEIEDSLFDGVLNGYFVDNDVDLLGQAVHAIDSLFFDELGWFSFHSKCTKAAGKYETYGIPEWLKDHHPGSCCEIETQRSALQAAKQNSAAFIVAKFAETGFT